MKVNRTLLGGGFGRRGTIQEFIRQAVLIAREVDAPVKLVWSRDEDVAHDLYRPFGMARLVAGLDREGMPVAWSIRLAGPSFVAAILPGFGKTFVGSSAEERTLVLDDIAWPKKAKAEHSQGVAFFNMFRDMTASGFWSSKIGVTDLDYQGNTFVPEWKGCPDAALQKLGVRYEG